MPQAAAGSVVTKLRRFASRAIRPLLARVSSLNSRRRSDALDAPNGPDEWEREYLTDVSPVLSLSHPVALILEQITSKGDVLLETGCGSATISAELGIAGRVIELGDFSDKILRRASELFRVSNLPAPKTTVCDLTKPLPWRDGAIDVVWSSGVLEHWTDEELVPIVNEMRRVARRKVVSLVPYAGSVLYRFAKYEAERLGKWPYGRELPRESLTGVFESAGLCNIQESVVWTRAAPNCLNLFDRTLFDKMSAWWNSLSDDDPVKRNQGYLLLTVGELATQ